MFEEDAIGDGMYIVLSGQCQIRARPSHAATIPQQQAVPLSSVGVDAKLTGSGQSTDSDGSEDEAEREAVQAAPRAVRSDAEHSASFWIHKYMQQVSSMMITLWQSPFAQYQEEPPQTIMWYISHRNLMPASVSPVNIRDCKCPYNTCSSP